MAPATFDLGQMQLEYSPSNLKITACSQLSITRLDGNDNLQSIQEILSAGTWVSRGNGLSLTIRIQIDPATPLNLDKDIAEDGFAELLSRAKLWTQLSLKVSRVDRQATQHLFGKSIDIILNLSHLDPPTRPTSHGKKEEKTFGAVANIYDTRPPAGILLGFLDSIEVHLTFSPSKAHDKPLPKEVIRTHNHENVRRSPRLARNGSQGVKYVYDTETSSEDDNPGEDVLRSFPVTYGELSSDVEMLHDTEAGSYTWRQGSQPEVLATNSNAAPDQTSPGFLSPTPSNLQPKLWHLLQRRKWPTTPLKSLDCNDMEVFERCERDRKMLFDSESSFSEEELLFDCENVDVDGMAAEGKILFDDEVIDSDGMDEDLFASYENTPNPSQDTVVGWMRRDAEEDMLLDMEERGEQENEMLFVEQQAFTEQDQETRYHSRGGGRGYYAQDSLVRCVNAAERGLEDSRYIDGETGPGSSPMLFDYE
ncbi:MAG: hypothetical protein Q9222_000608 [Ikaeria aurantiellina]